MSILKFPKIKQLFDYDCGAKCIEAVFKYYNFTPDYKKLMFIAKTNKNGTTVVGMEKALKKYNFKFKSARMTVVELKRYLHKGIPVIILLQGLSDKKISDWRNTWTEGHYVIANGIDNKKIYFEDPWHKPIKSLAFAELEERWHDIIKGHKYRYRGIAVFGQK